MRAPEILGLLMRAFGVWLLVMGLIQLPAAIGSILYLNSSAHVNPPATTSEGRAAIASANEILDSSRDKMRGLLWGSLLTELVKISLGAALLAGADGWVEWAYRQKKQRQVPGMFSET